MRDFTFRLFSKKATGDLFTVGAAIVVIGVIQLAKVVAKRTKDKMEKPEIVEPQDDVVDEHADTEDKKINTDDVADAVADYAPSAALIAYGIGVMAFTHNMKHACLMETRRRCNVNWSMTENIVKLFDQAMTSIIEMADTADDASNKFFKQENKENGYALGRVADAYWSAYHVFRPIDAYLKKHPKGYYFK